MVGTGLRAAGLLAFIAFAAAVPAHHAQAANRFLKKARRAYSDLKYEAVTPLLKKALRISKSKPEQVEIYALLAEMHVTYNREAQARRAFVEVLKREPDFTLSEDTSPKILAMLDAARLQLNIVPTTVAPSGEEQLQVEQTAATGSGPTEADTSSGSDADVVDAAPIGDSERDLNGATDPLAPSIGIRPAEESAFYESWWFWTALGVVAVGGAGGIAWATTRSPETPTGDFGPYPLP